MKKKDWIYGIEVNMSYHPNLNGLKEITQDTWDTIVAKNGTDWLDMQGCLFNNVDFEPVFESDERIFKITNGNFKDSTFQNCRMDVTDFDHCNFNNVHYLNCKFTDVNIQDSNLEGTYFSEPTIDACHFVSNNMTQSYFRAGEVKHTVFESNDMNKSYWDGTDIENDVTGRQNTNTDTIEIAVLGPEESEEAQSYRADIETVFGQPLATGTQDLSKLNIERQDNGNLYLNTPDLSGKENKEYRNRLKESGARYDPQKKDWYLPEGTDPLKGAQAVMDDINSNYQPKAVQNAENTSKTPDMQPYFKGFAYAQGQKKPSVFYGNSKEEILEKLNSYNQTRPEGSRFQSCNIGQLDAESNSYQQYHKYNMEGKDISNIYLQIPRVDRDEFLKITRQLKESGAKFNPVKKQWYITGDADLNQFRQYLPDQKPQPGTETAAQEKDMQAGPEKPAANHEGKEPGKIYLQIPHVERDEFLNITKQLKEAGAKFNPQKKQWYVSGDADLSRFEQYLPDQKPQPGTETAAQEDGMQTGLEDTAAKNEAVSQDGKPSQPWPEFQLSENYTITFADGRAPVTVPITKSLNSQTFEERKETIEELFQAIENSQPPATKTQDLSGFGISQRDGVNSCTIYFKDGQDPIELNGAEFGVDFSTMSPDEVSDFTKQFLQERQQEYVPLKIFEAGDKIDCFKSVPAGTEPIKGTVEACIEKDMGNPIPASYEVRLEDGSMERVSLQDLYTKQQAEVIQRAQEDRLQPEQMKLVCRNKYTPAQMEEIRFGLKDGLTVAQVESYADPALKPAQMDICRYALQHGVGAEDITKIIESDADWIGKRQAMDQVIKENRLEMAKEFKKQGFNLDKDLVKKMETLNHLTHKTNSLKDVCQAFKQGTYKDDFRINNIVKEVGQELQMQEIARRQAMLAAHA